MRRGYQQVAMRRVGRALRHGLVVAGVCVLIALVTGVSGYAFGDRPAAAHGQVLPAPTREAASTSREVLGRWLKPLADSPSTSTFSDARASVPNDVAVPLEVVTVSSVPLEVASTGTPEAEGRVAAQRLTTTAVPLKAGDRPLVSVSFYYCEEASGPYSSGDGGGFCGIARDGSNVRSGMAACDVAYLGQRFQIEGDPSGRTYVCADTGSAVHGLHRDIWFMTNREGWTWQQFVGRHAFIRILP